jgi:molybdopterin-guanine dinucleotide biosynthesis protein A
MLDFAGRPLWQTQARKLQVLQPAHLFIACREEQGLHESVPEDLKVEWMFDLPAQESGPILPILQALRRAEMPLLALAVDMPEMTPAFLSELMEQRPSTAFFFKTSQGIEPLAGLYTPALITLMEAAVATSQFSLRKLIEAAVEAEQAIVLPLSPTDEILFNNANTPGEWRGLAK